MAIDAISAPITDLQYKTCTKCGKEKLFSDFSSNKNGRFGLHPSCKSCVNEYSKRYRSANPEKRLEANRSWRSRNPDKKTAADRLWRANNPMKTAESFSKWRTSNLEARAASASLRYSIPKVKVSVNIASSIRSGIAKGSKRGRKTFSLLGYTREELMSHLESQFSAGMTWENYGDWHIDHIVPIAAHDYETPDDIDFKRAWSLSNLQPLWATDNLKKSAKLIASPHPNAALA